MTLIIPSNSGAWRDAFTQLPRVTVYLVFGLQVKASYVSAESAILAVLDKEYYLCPELRSCGRSLFDRVQTLSHNLSNP